VAEIWIWWRKLSGFDLRISISCSVLSPARFCICITYEERKEKQLLLQNGMCYSGVRIPSGILLRLLASAARRS
jgi:hypothetical protein